MSERDDRPVIPPPLESLPPERQASGCVTALIAIVGVILLLPGLCVLIFAGGSMSSSHYDSSLFLFMVIGLIVAVFGVLMIWAALRRGMQR